LAAFAILPTQIGYQDFASLIARQRGVAEDWQQHLFTTPFHTINASLFSLPRPVGAGLPNPLGYELASFDPRSLLPGYRLGRRRRSDYVYPEVERGRKGDSLAARAMPATAQGGVQPERPNDRLAAELNAALHAAPLPQYEPLAAEADAPLTPGNPMALGDPDAPHQGFAAGGRLDESPSVQVARLYFGGDSMGGPGVLEQWGPGEEPTLMSPRAPSVKDAARSSPGPVVTAKLETGQPGETVAAKGDRGSDEEHQLSPAERLDLSGKRRARAEKCLANAVYFEARGEAVRGQIAVAQVVMNRVFSGYYPDNVCGVVYQNARHHLACQFTFACDGIPDVVTEPEAWERAKRIAKETLDGKLWLPEVGKATHYHAYWVHPSWVHDMKKLHRLGVHTFYRPKNWGKGDDQPDWGNAADTAEAAKTL
jgi:spore germination cell wall hydrolase CwlJ-like protein